MIDSTLQSIKSVFSTKNKALLKELVITDFKLRYQNSVLGYLWSLLKPLMLFAILYVVFVNVFKLGDAIPHYSVYLLLGIVMWNFFAEMTNLSLGSIVGRGDLIRKISIPRWIIVLSTSLAALINLTLNLIVVAVFMVVAGAEINQTVIILPFIFIFYYMFSLGVSLFLAAAFVKFRDLTHIWEVVMQGAFYATPILYPLSLFSNPFYQKLLLANPVAFVMQEARFALITPATQTVSSVYGSSFAVLIPISVATITFLVGVTYFRSQSKSFAENI
jgi:ABC-2 type transport system permease protein